MNIYIYIYICTRSSNTHTQVGSAAAVKKDSDKDGRMAEIAQKLDRQDKWIEKIFTQVGREIEFSSAEILDIDMCVWCEGTRGVSISCACVCVCV